MKTLRFVGMLLCAVMLSVSASSCGDDEKGGGGKGLRGYYTDLSYVAKQSDFNEINEAINNHELLKSYYYGGERHNYYATKDLFIQSDGSFSDFDPNCGRLRFSINSQITVIRIVDDNTLYVYYAWLYEEGYGRGDVVYKIYAGPIFGNMAYREEPTIYSYVVVENKLIVSNGDIYTISGNTIRKDGSSSILTKYNP